MSEIILVSSVNSKGDKSNEKHNFFSNKHHFLTKSKLIYKKRYKK